MTKKEIDMVLMFGSSHILPVPGLPKGVTKFQAFLAIKPLLQGKLYWYALRNAYDMSDNNLEYKEDIRLAFLSKEPFREYLMRGSERKQFKDLPPKITIYRGMTEEELLSKDFGISWTLKRRNAEFFAGVYQRNYATKNQKKVIHSAVIDKSNVVAFFNERLEFEIIYIVS
jgi:hypothetical protein